MLSAALVAALLPRRAWLLLVRRIAVRAVRATLRFCLYTWRSPLDRLLDLWCAVHHDAVPLEALGSGDPQGGREALQFAHVTAAQATCESRARRRLPAPRSGVRAHRVRGFADFLTLGLKEISKPLDRIRITV